MAKPNWQNPATDNLFTAILQLRDLDEARNFFRDLLTEAEIIEFANRWQVAQMLQKGIPYSQIEQQTGMSSTTIARVSKYLNGRYGGYQLLLNRLNRPFKSLLSNLDEKLETNNLKLNKYSFGTQPNSSLRENATLQNHSHHSQTTQVESG